MSIKENIPNALTCCNLICGCYATAVAFYAADINAFYTYSVCAIILGAVFDFLDGMVARLLGVSSPIGKELDSLADVVTFGVAPSAIVFSLFAETVCPAVLLPVRKFMPYLAFLMAAFSALRLAKFNIDPRQSSSFIGLPTPANALFWGSLVLGCHSFLVSPRFNCVFLALFMFLFCMLLVAEIPLFALKFKNLSWRDNWVRYVFLVGCLPCLLLGRGCFAAIVVWYLVLSFAVNMAHR
ncbi:MAG: CDP-alcohol phosphatidyltransferase family protein [Prevotellaceae bacterium]|nr:CDP-alcohol phosphatidyltransferase family protein [Prevotellaceae bacterium]